MKRALLVFLALVACSDRRAPQPTPEPDRQRRVIEPPTRGVRALPPHAIRADGVGPFKLGATVSQLLQQLPSGPRITQYTIPGLVQRDILRAEEDAIVIGAEPQGKAKFIGIVRAEIARTEADVHVGSTRAELEEKHGAPLEEPDRALDPRLVAPKQFKNARFVLDGEQIIAIVIAADAERAKDAGADSPCTRPASNREKKTFGVCISQNGELARFEGDELALLARETEKPIDRVRVPGLVFAAALKNPLDGRDDLVAITKSEDAQERTWGLVAFRLHEGKLVRVIEPSVVIKLTPASARWIGADVRDLELYLELASRPEAIEVSGLLTARAGGKIRDIVVISPVSVGRKRAKPAPQEPAAPVAPDAATSSDSR